MTLQRGMRFFTIFAIFAVVSCCAFYSSTIIFEFRQWLCHEVPGEFCIGMEFDKNYKPKPDEQLAVE